MDVKGRLGFITLCDPPITGVVAPDVGVGVGKPPLGCGKPGDGVLHSLDEFPGCSSIGLSAGEPFWLDCVGGKYKQVTVIEHFYTLFYIGEFIV